MISHNSISDVRPCHLHQLYVNHNGDVYPCCRVWSNANLRIGHIDDPMIIELIHTYDKTCTCFSYTLRRIEPEDSLDFPLLNIEFSLSCQAKCAMCCVDAPTWQGSYTYYDSLTRLIDSCKPFGLLVQGGEVLVQPKTLEWLKQTKYKHPEIKLTLITNGCASYDMVNTVEQLFESVVVSIVGFEPETYKKIMDIELYKTKNFVENLIARRSTSINIKFLITPLSFHQTGLFLDWSAEILPNGIELADSDIASYINLKTTYPFWQRIINRTSDDIKAKIVKHSHILKMHSIHIYISPSIKTMFSISDEFIEKNSLQELIVQFE